MPRKNLVLGLDWDDTVSAFPEACAILANQFAKCVIITLNDDLSLETAKSVLNRADLELECCPYSRTDFTVWKIERCRAHQVAVMLDDDPEIIKACESAGIPAIYLGIPAWRSD